METHNTESYYLHRLRREAAFTPEHLHSDINQQVRSLHDVLSEIVSYPESEELKPDLLPVAAVAVTARLLLRVHKSWVCFHRNRVEGLKAHWGRAGWRNATLLNQGSN